MYFKLSLLAFAFIGSTVTYAHEPKNNSSEAKDTNIVLAQTVVPEDEKKRAQELLASGPKETTGISGVKLIGSVSLSGEFQNSDGLIMRVRELVIEPGGIVAVHEHNKRPGAAYIIEGEMTEHRSSEKGPTIKPAGTTAMEGSGVIHWWENTGSVPAKALVVDIVPES